jgi:hypothetical protein
VGRQRHQGGVRVGGGAWAPCALLPLAALLRLRWVRSAGAPSPFGPRRTFLVHAATTSWTATRFRRTATGTGPTWRRPWWGAAWAWPSR